MLSWNNQKDWSRKQATPKRELVMKIHVMILTYDALKQAMIDDEASQPQQDSALDH